MTCPAGARGEPLPIPLPPPEMGATSRRARSPRRGRAGSGGNRRPSPAARRLPPRRLPPRRLRPPRRTTPPAPSLFFGATAAGAAMRGDRVTTRRCPAWTHSAPARSMSPRAMDLAVHFRSAVALAGRFPALSGVDLDVDAGEVVAVLGPNGAGKTSLLRACAGLVPVISGEAVVLGCDLREDRASVRRRVGLFGHDPSLYDELTALENVRFAVRAAGLSTQGVGAALD